MTQIGDVRGVQRPQLEMAYGQAAFMLLEALMLTLIEQRVLTLDQLHAAVETVLVTKVQMAEDGEEPEVSRLASGLLRGLANSLSATPR
jgi:hypothetical protein